MLLRGWFYYFSILHIREPRLRTSHISPTTAGKLDPTEVFLLKDLPEPLPNPQGSIPIPWLGPFTLSPCPSYISAPRLHFPWPQQFSILHPPKLWVLSLLKFPVEPTSSKSLLLSFSIGLKSTPRNLPLLRIYYIFACVSSLAFPFL